MLRNYLTYRDYLSGHGNDIIEHGYWVYDEEGKRKKHMVTLSFSDLTKGIKELSPRKREAMFYNVILDWKQKDVAEKMGITTVSVGQYVEQATMQLAKQYFAEENDE